MTGIACTDCGTVGPAATPCANPDCAPPACPGCGRTPWHDTAICKDKLSGKTVLIPGCGYDAQAGRIVPQRRHP